MDIFNARSLMVDINGTKNHYNTRKWALDKLIISQDTIILPLVQRDSIFPPADMPDSIS